MATINITELPLNKVTINQNTNDPKFISTNVVITENIPAITTVVANVGVQGPPGSGLPGPIGPQGPPGTGLIGPQGIQGPKGDTGSGISSLTFNNNITSVTLEEESSTLYITAGAGIGIDIDDVTHTIDISNTLVGHQHTTTDIIGFNESVDDKVASLLQAGTSIGLTYNDEDFNKLIISVTGLNKGVDVQRQNPKLQSISDLVIESGKLLLANSSSTFEAITLSNTSKNFLNDQTVEEQRNTLGLGSISIHNSGTFAKIQGGNNFQGTQSFGDGEINRFSASLNSQNGNTYEIQQTDNGKIIAFTANNSSVNVNLSSNIAPGFNCLVLQLGIGQVRFSGSINNRYAHTKLVGQYSIATLVKVSTIPYIVVLSGDTTSDNSGP